jgi:pimeloyl-ACP methyl ester carboxylesterase
MGETTVPLRRNDLYVLVPGILGSTLSHKGSPVWSPSPRGVIAAITTFGRSVKMLELPSEIGDGEPSDGVVATGLFPDVHVIPGLWSFGLGYSKLVDFLRHDMFLTDVARRDGPPNLLLFAYDWRLSNRASGRRLARAIRQPLDELRKVDRDAKVQLICHSMGGLVARWYIAYEGGAADIRRLITIGTPHRGALAALDQLVNGPTLGRRVKLRLPSLADFVRSLPSVHQLLPQYACIHDASGLKKLTETRVPEVDTTMLNDGIAFHNELNASPPSSEDPSFRFYPMAGIRQSTATTATISHDRITASPRYNGEELYGDGTVPRLSAFPEWQFEDDPAIKWAANQHGALVHDGDVFGHLDGILSASPLAYRFEPLPPGEPDPFQDLLASDFYSPPDKTELRESGFGLAAPPLIASDEPLVVSIDGPVQVRLHVRVFDEHGTQHAGRIVSPKGETRLVISGLQPGAYLITAGPEAARPQTVGTGWLPRPVTTMTVIW